MDTVENVFLILAAAMIVAGSVAIAWLEFGSVKQRRLVSPIRDVFEVLLPVVLVIVLALLVALMGEAAIV